MKIIVLTQNDNIYLPQSLATICRALSSEIVCTVSSPVMSAHGGLIKGFLKHFHLFGVQGSFIMWYWMIRNMVWARLARSRQEGPFYSIKQVTNSFDLPYHKVSRIRDQQFQNILDKYKPDLLISLSCPQIIGKKIREKIPMGCINVHGAPLPKYRGLMPAFWVLCKGETKTAVSVHDLEAKIDDGEIILQREVEILSEDTWHSLVQRTKEVGAQALIDAVQQIKDGTVKRKPNPEQEATYFSFPTAKDRKAFVRAGRRFF